MNKRATIAALAAAALLTLTACEGVDTSSGDTSSDTSAEKKADDKSQAQQLKDCVSKDGTPTEQKAVTHVTKVTGASNGEILGAAEVFTDFTGGVTGPHPAEGKLIASAFASCWETKDGKSGLVTVYDKDGELLSNGNY
ncbi:hypothetical protein [Streptomyces europaeiscabiei]|uniref:hypothetical protein n=1 Tax=Streptomyces europaeiscabiei TaxID=146819 RepID=UPI0029B0B278|nr:hypothetical protein [Streptomyces europaeiscabiei]MDX3582525.1 hypothetical protein [Streptomyces europaeiscabiei]